MLACFCLFSVSPSVRPLNSPPALCEPMLSLYRNFSAYAALEKAKITRVESIQCADYSDFTWPPFFSARSLIIRARAKITMRRINAQHWIYTNMIMSFRFGKIYSALQMIFDYATNRLCVFYLVAVFFNCLVWSVIKYKHRCAQTIVFDFIFRYSYMRQLDDQYEMGFTCMRTPIANHHISSPFMLILNLAKTLFSIFSKQKRNYCH